MKCSILKNDENNLFLKNIGESFEVLGFGVGLEQKYLRRLTEIGLTIGTSVKLLRKSIRGKTFLIEIRGAVYSMQREIISQIIVKKV